MEPFNFNFFSITGRGINLDYHDIEWFALEMNRGHSVVFEIASKYCISDTMPSTQCLALPSTMPAVAKLFQSCLTLCNPIDGSPPGSSIPGILQQEHWSGLPFPSPMHESGG